MLLSIVQSYRPAVMLAAILALLLTGCNQVEGPVSPDGSSATASSVSHAGCKVFSATEAGNIVLPDKTCLVFSYDGSDSLHITRIDAAFNCCPDSLCVEVLLENGEISIIEKEDLTSGGCDCICLFDLEYTISGIEPGTYTIDVEELYPPVNQTNPRLRFTVDFTVTPTGSFCVAREGYPWANESTLSTTVTSFEGCKSFDVELSPDSLPLLNCVNYLIDTAGVLSIRHENAMFNCCADSLAVAVSLLMDTIIVTEQELFIQQDPCRCVCPFDLVYHIPGIPAGQYTMRVIGPYVDGPGDVMVFDIDVAPEVTGSFCIPWPSGEEGVAPARLKSVTDCPVSL